MFNPVNCFAKGKLVLGKDEKPVLTGNCQVMQFGKNSSGNDCMFVCQMDFTEGSQQRVRPVLASFVFDRVGRVIDLYYGNSAETPSWETNVHDGTRASFGNLPPLSLESLLSPTQSKLNEINREFQLNHREMQRK